METSDKWSSDRLRYPKEIPAAFDLWFFRDLGETQRRQLINICGFPGIEANGEALQRRLLQAILSRLALGEGEKEERAWPDIGPDPFLGPRKNDNVKAAHKRLRDAYAKQQPIVPNQTALVWRIDIGRVHQRLVQLEALFADREAHSDPLASEDALDDLVRDAFCAGSDWQRGNKPGRYEDAVKPYVERARQALAALSAPSQVGEGWRPEVVAFANLMEQQLRANDHKPGWKQDDARDLLNRLREEASEVGDELQERQFPRPVFVGRECADVANFAMMIADVCGALSAAPVHAGEG